LSGISYEWQGSAERKGRITELEDWLRRPADDVLEQQKLFGEPHFIEELVDIGDLKEAEPVSLVCRLEPVGDPTMRIVC
jgi:hypothetical protein